MKQLRFSEWPVLRSLALTLVLIAQPAVAQQPAQEPAAAEPEVQRPVAPPPPPPRPPEQLVPLRGRVVAADTGEGLQGARLTVVAGGRALEPVFTDASGAFEVRASPTAVNELSVAKAGFVSTTVGRRVSVRRVRPEPVFEIALARGAVIAGSVRDELGNPAPNVTVRVRLVRPVAPSTTATSRPTAETSTPVQASGSAQKERTVETDDLGEFRIGGLVPGSYLVRARRQMRSIFDLRGTGVVDGQTRPVTLLTDLQRAVEEQQALEEQDAPPDVPVDLESGQQVAQVFLDVLSPPKPLSIAFLESGISLNGEIKFVVPPVSGGVVTGTVLDEFGEPVEGAEVELRPLRYEGGRGVLGEGMRGRKTDDRGRFRLFDVPEDVYYLALVTAQDVSAPFAPVYYPGRAALYEASLVSVEDGKERSEMDLTFAVVRNVRLRGVVVDSAGNQGLTGQVTLAARVPSGVISLPGPETPVAEDGTFEIANVPPGGYVVQALGKGSTGAREFGLEYVNVGGADVDFVGIATKTGSRLAGRVQFDGPVAAGRPAAFGVSVWPTDPAYAPALTVSSGGFIGADGTFEITGLLGPGFLVLEDAPDGWWLKSVTIGGVNVTDAPVLFGWRDLHDAEVVVATSSGRLTVRVAGCARAGPIRPGCEYIVVFPVDERLWFPRSRHLRLVGADDRYAVSGLPPGDYWVAAIDRGFEKRGHNTWQHPEFLRELLGAAHRVQIGKEGTTVVDLELSTVRKP